MKYTDYLQNTELISTPLLCNCVECPDKCGRFNKLFTYPYNYIIGKPYKIKDGKVDCPYDLKDIE